MSLFQLFKTAFVQPKNLLIGKNKSFGKIFLYFLFLSLVICIPIGVQLVKVVGTMQTDIEAITNKLPDFSVAGNQLITSEKDAGFIYQTDYLIFSFDPEEKRDIEDIQQDLIANVVGIALLKDRLVLAVTDDNLLSSVLPKTVLEMPYDSFDSSILNKSWVQANTSSTITSPKILIVAFLVLFIPLTFDFMLTILMISLFANIFTRLRQSPLTFSDTLKITVLAATVPVVLSAAMTTVTPAFNSNFLVMFLTLFTYIRVVTPTLPKRPLK